MYQSDYIMRMIEMLGVMWRRLLAALRAVRPEEALQIANEAVGLVAETTPDLIDALDAKSLVAFLSAGGALDVEKAALLAAVLDQRGKALDALDRYDEAQVQWEKAAALREAALAADPERYEAVMEALASVDERPLEDGRLTVEEAPETGGPSR